MRGLWYYNWWESKKKTEPRLATIWNGDSMLSAEINETLNKQIQAEFYASHLYLSMAAHAESLNLPGIASWMRNQSEEERAHALRLFDYVLDREGTVELRQIDQPPQTFGSANEMFKQVLDHERKVTQMISDAYQQATEGHDHATQVQLQWFVTEQVEEEKTASDINAQMEMAGNDTPTLLMLDRELGVRSTAGSAE